MALLAPSAARARARVAGLDYVVPPDCPAWSELAATVARRTGGRWRVQLGAGEPHFTVEIADDPAGKIGFLRRSSGGASTTARELTAAACADLVQALALTAALSLDEERDDPALGRPARVLPPPPDDSAPTAARALFLGLDASLGAILPPGPMSGAGLLVEWAERPRTDRPRAPALRAPDVALGVQHARNDLLGRSLDARFTLTTAALAVCPLSWVWLRACATAELGMLAAEGVRVAQPAVDRSLWAAAGAALRAGGEIGGRVRLEGHAGVRLPLRRTEFVFDVPREAVATVPGVVVDGGLAIGWAMP